MKKYSKLIIIILIILVAIIFLSRCFSIYSNKSELEHGKAIINGQEVWLEIAKTPAEQEKGLSGRDALAEDEGMLFVFEVKGKPAFWMKDMKFPLDLIWLDNDKVVDISKNVPVPAGENPLPLYRPVSDINYVLEVNAGFAAKNNLQLGDKIQLEF